MPNRPITRSQTKKLNSQPIVNDILQMNNDDLTEHIHIFRALHGDFIPPPITSEDFIRMNRTQFISRIYGGINHFNLLPDNDRQRKIIILFDMYKLINAYIQYFIKHNYIQMFFVCTLFCKALEFENYCKTRDMSEIDNHLLINFMSELNITKKLVVLEIKNCEETFTQIEYVNLLKHCKDLIKNNQL